MEPAQSQASTPEAPNDSPSPSRKPWATVLATAMLVGLVSWFCGERTVNHFQTVFRQPPNWNKMNAYERDDYRSADQIRQTPAVEVKNVSLVFGALGILLGGALGAVGGASRKSPGAGLIAGGIASATGAILASVAAYGSVTVFYQYLDPEMSLIVPVLTHSALFAAVGAGAGLGLGLGLGGRGSESQATIGGLCGGLIGAVAYDLVMATIFADVRILDPIPKEPPDHLPRLLMHVIAAVSISVIALGSIGSSEKPTKPSGRV